MGRFGAFAVSLALSFRDLGALPQWVSASWGFLILVLARFVFGC